MNLTSRSKNLLIVGAPGSGKSLALGYFLSFCTGRVWILSTVLDSSILSRFVPSKIVRLRSPLQVQDLAPFLEGGESLYFVVENLTSVEVASTLAFVAKYARDLCLVVDEARTLLGGAKPSDDLLRLYRGARHVGVTTVTVTQRLVDIPADIRIVFSDLFIFTLTSFRDLKVIAEELPDRGLVEAVQTLRPLDYLYVDKQDGKRGFGSVPLPA